MLKDIKETIHLININNKTTYSSYSQLYAFTTENIKGYFNLLDFKDKELLTVCGSGDHVLNAILLGSKNITCFDINKLAYYILNLKIAAVKALELDQFLNYFMLNNREEEINNETFNYDIYLEIKKFLPADVKKFWNSLYESLSYNGLLLRNSNLFNNKYDNYSNKYRYNLYLELNNYNYLKSMINTVNINFIHSSLNDINNYLDKKYDLILLSNISDYIKDTYKDNYLEEYKLFIQNTLSKSLNDNGLIVSAYIYDYNKTNKGRSDIDIESKREKVFTKKYITNLFESAIDKNKQDGIIIYKGDGNNGK